MPQLANPTDKYSLVMSFPAELKSDVDKALCKAGGYSARVPIQKAEDRNDPTFEASTNTIAQPLSEEEFARKTLISLVVNMVRQYRQDLANQQLNALVEEAMGYIGIEGTTS